MADPLGPQLIFGDTSQGVITGVSYRIAPKNSVAHAVNLSFDDSIGEMQVRDGSTRVGSAALNGSNSIDGLFQFVDSEGGANSQLLATSNGTTYYLNGAAWTSTLTGDTAGLKTRFATFLDRVVRVNGTDAAKAWDGSSSWSGGGGPLDLSNFPIGKFVTVYKDQVIVLGVNGSPDTMRISSVPTSGVISWTSGDRTITINPDDGGNITGHGQIAGLLIVFKDDGMFRWNNRSTDADRIIDVGCSSHESIASGGNSLFFFNSKGVWVTQGGYPILISRKVQKWIDNMDDSPSDVSGWCDGRFYRCSIGNCTIDGRTYSNIILKYNLNTQVWSVMSYASKPSVMAQYKVSGDVRTIYGDTTSSVVWIDSGSGTDFNSSPIAWEVESHEQDFGSRARYKEIRDRMVGYSTIPDTLITAKSETGDWKTIGHIKEEISDLRFSSLRGRYFKFRASGQSRTGGVFKGLEISNLNIQAYGS